MSYKIIFDDIKNKKLNNLYLLYGREKYLFDSIINSLEKKYENNSFKEFNFEIIDAGDKSVKNLVSSFETLPFMDDEKIVIVKNCLYFNSIKTGISDKETEQLLNYFKNPLKSTIVIFYGGITVDKKRKLYKSIKKNGSIIELNKLSETDLTKWMIKEFKNGNKKIEREAVKFLIKSFSYLNKNSTKTIYDIKNEINKLVNLIGEKASVEVSDIKNVIENSLETDIFELVDSIGNKNAKSAILLFDNLITRGESEFLILNMISRQFRMLKKTLVYIDAGFNPSAVASKIGVPPFVAKKYSTQCRRFGSEKLSYIISNCVNSELKIKTGLNSPRREVEMLIIKSTL